ncbi:hypothetical protein [Bradyrhizobium vignae]|nr:hypothetical protein [Bradyrhizobium vignae]
MHLGDDDAGQSLFTSLVEAAVYLTKSRSVQTKSQA